LVFAANDTLYGDRRDRGVYTAELRARICVQIFENDTADTDGDLWALGVYKRTCAYGFGDRGEQNGLGKQIVSLSANSL
jgi:hypothetical protein